VKATAKFIVTKQPDPRADRMDKSNGFEMKNIDQQVREINDQILSINDSSLPFP
jgi:hypothetical protein